MVPACRRALLLEQHTLKTSGMLALEEAMLEASGVCGFCLATVWSDSPAIVAGRNSRLDVEVDLRAAEALGIDIYRRLTGGGSVYHDYGNLNVSIALPVKLNVTSAHGLVSGIVAWSVRRLGLIAHVDNEGDVVVGRWKVSGSAVYISRKGVLVHATLLVDADLDVAYQLLRPRWDLIARGRVAPSKYRPANLGSILPGLRVYEARKALVDVVKDAMRAETVEPWPGLLGLAEELRGYYEDPIWRIAGRFSSRKISLSSAEVCPREYLHEDGG